MNELNETTFESIIDESQLRVTVGDEKQDEFLPRVKIEKWDNDANLSIGVIADGGEFKQDGDKIFWDDGEGVEASFYSTKEREFSPWKAIFWIDEGSKSPQYIAASYEVDRHFKWEHQTIRTHTANEKAMLYYGYYPASMFIDRDKIDIPEVRMSAAIFNDPMIMDEGLPLICVHYNEKRDDIDKMHRSMKQAIKDVLTPYGIKITENENGVKMYFEHEGKQVKFFSTAFVQGYYYFYLNLDCDYNSALDYYKEATEPRADQFAYGLRAVADIPDSVVGEIVERYAELYGLPLNKWQHNDETLAKIEQLEKLQSDFRWVWNAKRYEPYSLRADEWDEKGFEFDITLQSKPESNVFSLSIQTKGLEFFKQPTIPQSDVEKIRSPRIEGSWAAYHQTKKHNEFGAGKAFHIYRPIITDANGWQVWGDLDIDDSQDLMNITIPQEFLDSAAYPIVIDPTVGYTTIGASTESCLDIILATAVTTPSSFGQVGAIVMATAAGALNVSFQGAIYDSSGNLLHQSGSKASVSPGASWYGLNFSSHPRLDDSTDYRLAIWGDGAGGEGGTPAIYYDSTGGKTSYSLAQTFVANSFPSSLSGATTQSNRQYSIYLTGGYLWPIMGGSSASLAAANAERNMPIATASDTTWATGLSNQLSLGPAIQSLTDWKFVLTTAPDVGKTRTADLDLEGAVSFITSTISGTSTEGTDSDGALPLRELLTVAIHSVGTGTPTASAGSKWRLAATGTAQPWFASSISALSTTATRYMEVQGGAGLATATASATMHMPPDSGVLQNFRAKMIDGTLSAGSYTLTLVKNGVDTAAVIVLDSANQSASYTATTISITDQDTLYWKIVPSAGTAPSAARRVAISCEYQSNTAGRGVLMGGTNANVGSVLTYGTFGLGAWNTTESAISALAYTMKVVAARATLSAAPSSTHSRTGTFRKGGAATSASVTISGANTTGSWTGEVQISTDDLISWEHNFSGTPTNSNMKWGIVFDVNQATFVPKVLVF